MKKKHSWEQSMYLVGCQHSLETSSEIEVHCTQPVNDLLCLLSLDLALSSNASPGTNSISCTSNLPPSSSVTFTAEICGSAFFSSSICVYCGCNLPVWMIDPINVGRQCAGTHKVHYNLTSSHYHQKTLHYDKMCPPLVSHSVHSHSTCSMGSSSSSSSTPE